MLAELRRIIAKASKAEDDGEKIFELTNFDVQEVSNVDAPANEQPYLLIKGALTMSTKKLQEILGDGAGEFISKLDGDADAGNAGDGNASEGDGDASVLKLSEVVKNETLQNLGVVIKALIDVAKAVDAAEVVAEGGALPDEIKTIVRSSSQVLGKMLGEDAGAGDAGDASEQGKSAAAGGGTVTKAKIDGFQQDLDTIGSVIEQLQSALGVKGAGGDDGKGAASVGDNPELVKALSGVTQLLKRQNVAISDLRNRVGLPSALPAEGEQITKRAADDFDGWPLDMNEDRRRAAR
jgi:hypothetical protein